jgi:hypothetical protein
MKSGALMIGSIAIAVIYAVAFSTIYPSVTVDGGVISLCALAGFATALAVAGLWHLVRGAKPS